MFIIAEKNLNRAFCNTLILHTKLIMLAIIPHVI